MAVDLRDKELQLLRAQNRAQARELEVLRELACQTETMRAKQRIYYKLRGYRSATRSAIDEALSAAKASERGVDEMLVRYAAMNIDGRAKTVPETMETAALPGFEIAPNTATI